MKMYILLSDNEFVDDDIREQDNEEIAGLLNALPDAEGIQEYFQIIDQNIPTEEFLTDEQIVNMVLTEEKEESDIEEEEEVPPVLVNKAIDGLKTFINYFEQQDNSMYNIEDLKIFRKYLRIAKVEDFNSKKQSTIDMYYER
jgi:hypothetical protein